MTEPSEKKKKKVVDQYLVQELGIDYEKLKKLKKKLEKVEGKPERGVETWFRLASKNLYSRLQIVDTKANILITSNAIIISVVLGTLYAQLDEDPHMIFAVGGLVITNVLSITYAILATIPEPFITNKKEIDSEDLMTFEGFANMNIEDYRTSVMNILEKGETLYPSLITDIHNLGITLAKKYKLIRISYLVFLIGIIISVILFALCHAIF